MSYNTKSIIKDVNGKPVPQYWNKTTQQYEVIQSNSGKIPINIVDNSGSVIQIKSILDSILFNLDEIIRVVSE
jgi:hypothetical protein